MIQDSRKSLGGWRSSHVPRSGQSARRRYRIRAARSDSPPGRTGPGPRLRSAPFHPAGWLGGCAGRTVPAPCPRGSRYTRPAERTARRPERRGRTGIASVLLDAPPTHAHQRPAGVKLHRDLAGRGGLVSPQENPRMWRAGRSQQPEPDHERRPRRDHLLLPRWRRRAPPVLVQEGGDQDAGHDHHQQDRRPDRQPSRLRVRHRSHRSAPAQGAPGLGPRRLWPSAGPRPAAAGWADRRSPPCLGP